MSQKISLKQRIEAYFDAWNQSDTQLAASFFDPDAVYVDTAFGIEYRNQEIEEYIDSVINGSYERFSVAISNEPVINGDVVFLQSTLTVILNNAEHKLESAELFHFRGENIVLVQTYYNLGDDIGAIDKDSEKETGKYAKSGLDKDNILFIKQQLDNLITTEQIYKDSGVKLQDIADKLQISRNHLSQVLNHEYKMKFFDFINHHRLQSFINSLHENQGKAINITELAYDAGFSSSSVFYKIFKRYQDISPGQYIKNLQNNR